MSKVGIPPPHNSGKPHALMAVNTTTTTTIYIQRYIDTNEIYMRSRTSISFLVQVIHQYNDSHGEIQTMKY